LCPHGTQSPTSTPDHRGSGIIGGGGDPRDGRRDLEVVLDWAAGECWNPGRHDATAFEAVDPDGLLIGLVDGEPVAAIACPRARV
jgi:hypothetical protein